MVESAVATNSAISYLPIPLSVLVISYLPMALSVPTELQHSFNYSISYATYLPAL